MAFFAGSFIAESMEIAIPADCTDPVAFMRDWIANGRSGCMWFQFGERIKGLTTFADGSTKTESKTDLEPKRYYNGGTAIMRSELSGTFRDSIDGNYPDAIGGIKLRNGWGQPLMAEDVILEAVK